VNEVRVSSWHELNEQLYLHSWQEQLRRFRSRFAFRGQPDASSDLRTGLMRLGGAYACNEGHLLRNFRKYALRSLVSWPDSLWNWLAVAQHHGLPTRLLDWTYSPYVALHFVTANLARAGEDGVVWCVDYVGAHERLPAALKDALREEGADVFTVEMLDRAAPSLQELDALADQEFALFFEPPSLDERIVNQFALFSVMSSPCARLDAWLERHPEVCQRIVVPAALKWEVRDKLDQANVTERVLFPGLDGLSQWLARYYSPRPEQEDGRST
jgi:hypothetical protein